MKKGVPRGGKWLLKDSQTFGTEKNPSRDHYMPVLNADPVHRHKSITAWGGVGRGWGVLIM